MALISNVAPLHFVCPFTNFNAVVVRPLVVIEGHANGSNDADLHLKFKHPTWHAFCLPTNSTWYVMVNVVLFCGKHSSLRFVPICCKLTTMYI